MAYTLQNFISQAVFLFSGIFFTLITQTLFNVGAGARDTLLTVIAQYLGMTLCRFLPVPPKTHNSKGSLLLSPPKSFLDAPLNIKKGILIITSFNVLGNILSTIGLSMTGSGIYQVIHASIIVFNAIFSKYILKKTLNKKQWISVFAITFGLSLSAIGKDGKLNSPIILLGIIIKILGTISFSVVYVLNEKLLKLPGGPTTVQQSSWIGTGASSICFVYILIYTLPNYKTLIIDRVKENYLSQSYEWIYFCYFLLLLCHILHSYTYYWITESSGAVTLGVIQALRAVTVFYFSSYFFCKIDNTQCLTVYKIESCLVVVTAIVFYSYASRKKKEETELELEHTSLISEEGYIQLISEEKLDLIQE